MGRNETLKKEYYKLIQYRKRLAKKTKKMKQKKFQRALDGGRNANH